MVVGTESTHRPVVDPRPDLKGLRISLMGDLVEREGAENELSLEPEHVEGVGSIGRVEGAEADHGLREMSNMPASNFAITSRRRCAAQGAGGPWRSPQATLGARLFVHRSKERTLSSEATAVRKSSSSKR